MAVHNFAFPVLPGREDAAREFATDALGAHAAHYSELMRESGTTRVTWTLQQTPAGSFILVWFEAEDVQKIFEILATSDSPAAAWMRGSIERTGGADMREPPPGPPPELILQWP